MWSRKKNIYRAWSVMDPSCLCDLSSSSSSFRDPRYLNGATPIADASISLIGLTRTHALFPNIVRQKRKGVRRRRVGSNLWSSQAEKGSREVYRSQKNSEQWKYGRQEILATLGISPVPISSLNGPRSKTQRDRAQKLYFCHFHIDPPFVWRCEFIGSSCQVTQWQKTLFYFGANLGLMHIYPTRLSLPPSAPK